MVKKTQTPEIIRKHIEEIAQKNAIKKYCRQCAKGIFKVKDCQCEFDCSLWRYRLGETKEHAEDR